MIYVFLADGFEEIEALATVDVLRRAEIETVTVGVGTKTPVGTHNIKVEADITEEEATAENITGVVLPGGLPGAWNLLASKRVEELTRYCFENGKLVTAICAAPSVLGDWGMLNGKKATCYPGFEDRLSGAEVCPDAAVSDGFVITGKGAGAALEFAFKIVEKLCSKEKAESIKEAMQCIR
ncbi:MAG: DJ-1/PfpI family protein [Clostridia bacterium]|nr:DJ-1/PfpI family protein [Clostridia bacterium]